jgi:hypothetical protein
VSRLEASDTTATTTNRLNRLPTVVRSLLWTTATILGETEVMRSLVSLEARGPSGHVYSTGASGGGGLAASGLRLRNVIVRAGPAHALPPG